MEEVTPGTVTEDEDGMIPPAEQDSFVAVKDARQFVDYH